jgi:hypothetical protein
MTEDQIAKEMRAQARFESWFMAVLWLFAGGLGLGLLYALVKFVKWAWVS